MTGQLVDDLRESCEETVYGKVSPHRGKAANEIGSYIRWSLAIVAAALMLKLFL